MARRQPDPRTKRRLAKHRKAFDEGRNAAMLRAAERLRKGREALARGRATTNAHYLGPDLANIILARGTWAAISRALKVTPATISRWLNGAREPSYSNGLRMAAFLRLDPWVFDSWLGQRRAWRREEVERRKTAGVGRAKARGRYAKG